MIKVNKLSFSYDKKKKFIKDLSFNIEKGKITTILGPNGSGKSTVLSLLCGLNKISSGEIIINDKDIKNMKYKDIAKEIATVHQQNTVPDDITVKELIAYGRMPHKKYFAKNSHDDEEIVKWAIERTGLEPLKDKEVMSMSGGERQRVFIAMALAQKSKILFLDEPTTYLDIYHQIELEIWNSIDQKQINTVIPLMIIHLEIKRQNVLVYKLKLQVEISLQWTNERMFLLRYLRGYQCYLIEIFLFAGMLDI